MSPDTHLPGQDAMLADLGGAGNTHLRRHGGVLAYLAVVGYLYQVVELHAAASR